MLLSILLLACTSVEEISRDTYSLVRVQEGTTTRPAAEVLGDTTHSIEALPDRLEVLIDDEAMAFPTTIWPRKDWVEGCPTQGGATRREVRIATCDGSFILGAGEDAVELSCPFAAMSSCGSTGVLYLMPEPAPGAAFSGCGTSSPCLLYEI